jgi:uncharacterized iron-regulated membrane protein
LPTANRPGNNLDTAVKGFAGIETQDLNGRPFPDASANNMNLRAILLWFHRYLGLLATLPLVLLGLSGAVLTFEAELDRAINPTYWHVTPQGQPMAWQDVIAAARRAYPGEPPQSLRFPTSPDVAAELTLKGGRMVTVNPYTGGMLGSRRQADVLTARIHQFHTRLLMDKAGQWITGTSTFILLVLGPTGLVLWWRRKGFGIKWPAPWRRVNYDAHHAFGIFGLLPWMVLGLTGGVMVFEGTLRPAPPKHEAHAPAPRSSSRPAHPIPVDAALDAASRALPGAQITLTTLPSNAGGAFLVYMKFPEDRTPAGRSHVAIDAANGSVQWVENSRTAPATTRLWNLNRPLHTGDIFGWPTRLLACLASLAMALQAISGVWMWWPRRKRKDGSKSQRTPAGIGAGITQ